MFPNVYFICMEYRLQVYKQTYYLLQYLSKFVTETAEAKINVTKNDVKETVLVIADANLVARVSKSRILT